MQKLVTINTHTNILEDNPFIETEYPLINQYLEEGYKIIQIIPHSTAATNAYMYVIIVVLERD